MKNVTNEDKYKNYKYRKVLRILIIVFGCITIILSILSLLKYANVIFPIITLLLTHMLSLYRNSLSIK